MDAIKLKIIILTMVVYIIMVAIFNMGKKLKEKGESTSNRDLKEIGTITCLLSIFTALGFTITMLILLDIIQKVMGGLTT